MDNLIQLNQGAKAYGSKRLFEEASFSINEGEHVGVIGPNGAGKTTLFKVMVGEEELDLGEIVRSRRLRIGYLSQHDHWHPGETIEEFVSRDAHIPVWELKSLGRSLGLQETDYVCPVESFSGGYRMRAKLLRLIGQQPNLMLLDEPTNYLDLETVMVLEKFLQGFEGAFLLISHDREFLRRTTDHILEVESGEVTKYNGSIDDYFEQKELLRTQLEARALSQEEKRKQVLDFVARFGAKATKASQAQSRLKMLDRMEKIEIKSLPVTAKIKIPPPARTGKLILTLQGVDLGYGTKTILKNINLQIASGNHLAVVGLNGAGKSTLLKAIGGRLSPQKGKLELGYESTFAFFNQYVAEELDPNDTVIKALERKAHSAVLPQEILDLAGSLLFSGDSIRKSVRVLSGGEKSRVALGQVLLQKASCLILDEPTNHLDFQTVEALTQSLQNFAGSMIVVSHDRSFISRVGKKILEVQGGQVGLYPGSYDEYVWSVEKGAFATLKASTSESPSASGKAKDIEENPPEAASSNYKEKKKALDRRHKQLVTLIEKLDKQMEEHSQKIHFINQELVQDPSLNYAEKIRQMGEVQTKLSECESQWFSAAEEKTQIEAELDRLVKGG